MTSIATMESDFVFRYSLLAPGIIGGREYTPVCTIGDINDTAEMVREIMGTGV